MPQVQSTRPVKFWEKLCVGGIAGIIGTSIVYPLDMVKTRLQRQVNATELKYKGPVHCFKTIIKEEGAAGLYRGILANLIGVTPEKAIKLAVNDGLREYLKDKDGRLPLWKEVIAGAGAGFCQVIATNPMEITKIRMQVQATLPAAERTGLWAVCKDLGIRGMYKGATITLLRDVPYSMIFFPLNSNLKKLFSKNEDDVSLSGLMISGMSAGAFASGIMTPMDVIKTRVQAAKGSKSDVKFGQMFMKVYREEGFKALYKGTVPRMCVQAPLFAIALTAFELQKRYIMYGTFFPK
ncbi:hypothetical protein WA158_005394 [Blastocystis sp. Blastoise]